MNAQSGGIYLIVNRVDGKLYIGSTIRFDKRWATHRSESRRGKHSNRHFQNAWNFHGEDAFLFLILEEVQELFLVEREQFFMDEAKREGWTLYNELEADRHNPWNAGKPGCFSTETIEKMRQAKLGKKLTPEHAFKLGAVWRGKKRPKFSDEWRQKIAKARAGQIIIGVPRPDVRGVPRSEEVRAKISAGQSRRWAQSRLK